MNIPELIDNVIDNIEVVCNYTGEGLLVNWREVLNSQCKRLRAAAAEMEQPEPKATAVIYPPGEGLDNDLYFIPGAALPPGEYNLYPAPVAPADNLTVQVPRMPTDDMLEALCHNFYGDPDGMTDHQRDAALDAYYDMIDAAMKDKKSDEREWEFLDALRNILVDVQLRSTDPCEAMSQILDLFRYESPETWQNSD